MWLNLTSIRQKLGARRPSAAFESNADNPVSIERYLKKRRYRRVRAKTIGHVAGYQCVSLTQITSPKEEYSYVTHRKS